MGVNETEGQAQKLIFEWVNWNVSKYPMLKAIYHIPNEGKRSKAAGAEMKRQGMKSGVSDICLPCASSGYSNLYVELKVGTTKVSDAQREFVNAINEFGGKAVIVYGSDNAIQVIEAYIKGNIDELAIKDNTYPPTKEKQGKEQKKEIVTACGISCRECTNKDCLGKKVSKRR